jgi:hypothetical protein
VDIYIEADRMVIAAKGSFDITSPADYWLKPLLSTKPRKEPILPCILRLFIDHMH